MTISHVNHAGPTHAAHRAQSCPPENVGGATVSFRDGALSVKGTKEGDDIALERVDANTVKLTVNGEERLYTGVRKANLDGRKGDDTISVDPNLGIDLKVNGGHGRDSVAAQARVAPEADLFDRAPRAPNANGREPRVRIAGGRGDDEIVSDFDYAKLLGGNGQDTIDTTGRDTRVRAGAGDDVVIDSGIRANIRAGRGNDLVVTEGLGADVRGRGGDDRFLNEDPAARIRGGRGRDRVLDLTGTAKVRNAERVDEL